MMQFHFIVTFSYMSLWNCIKVVWLSGSLRKGIHHLLPGWTSSLLVTDSPSNFIILFSNSFKEGDYVTNQEKGNVHRRLNASWKICSLAVNGQSFLVIDGYLLNPFLQITVTKNDKESPARVNRILSELWRAVGFLSISLFLSTLGQI